MEVTTTSSAEKLARGGFEKRPVLRMPAGEGLRNATSPVPGSRSTLSSCRRVPRLDGRSRASLMVAER